MAGHDQLSKDLFQAFLADLLRLVVPHLAEQIDLKPILFLSGELFTDIPQGDERRLDLVAKVKPIRGDPEALLLHVECESEARSGMPWRLRRYDLQLELRHDLTVVPIVVYRQGGPPGVRRERLRHEVLGEERWRYGYYAFGLSGARAMEYLNQELPLAWALAALMRRENLSRVQHKIECLRRIAGAPVDEARRFLLANFVETYIELDGDDAEQYQTLLAEEENQEVKEMELTWADKIELKGVERGIEEGIQKGIRKGIRQVFLKLATQRFGPPSASVSEQIERIESITKLNNLVERVLSAGSWADLGFA